MGFVILAIYFRLKTTIFKVSSFPNDDIKDVQGKDPDHGQFMEIYFRHSVKPHSRELAGKSS